MKAIETRIAKNGSTRYYVREENGKLKAISYDDAMMYQRQNERYQKWLANNARESQIAAIDDYAVSTEAQEVAIEAETKLANNETKVEVTISVAPSHCDDLDSDTLAELNDALADITEDYRCSAEFGICATVETSNQQSAIENLFSSYGLWCYNRYVFTKETDNGEENTNAEVDNTNTTTALVPAEFYAKHEIKLNIDDFDTKLAELKADCNQKAAELDTARAALEQATIAYDDADQKWADAAAAVNNLCRDKARQLTAELDTITSNTSINIQFRDGNYRPLKDWQLWIDFGNDTFKVCADKKAGIITNIIAYYDTPAQVETAINQLKAAIARGDNQFKFPTVDELINPPVEKKNTISDSLARAMKFALEKVQAHCQNKDLKAAQNEMELYNICAAALHDSCTGGIADDPDDTPPENDNPNDTIDKLNQAAPDGWLIAFDSDKKVFHVKFNDKIVTTLDSLALQKFLTPAQFFDQFRPLVDDNFSPKQQFINDRIREIQALQDMRSDAPPDSLAKINELIEQNKRDLLQAEFNEKET